MKTLDDVRSRRNEILRIAEGYGARNLRVFGSRARGDSTAQSDLDLLITLDAGRSLLDIVALKQDLEDLLGLRIDVVTEAAVSPYMIDEIRGSAVAL